MCFWQLSNSGHFASLSIGFNLITNFSGTRSMAFHQSGCFFKYQNDGIWLIWSLKFQNALHLSTLSKNKTELYSWPEGHLSNGFQEKKTEKTFKKLFFHTWKMTLFRESSRRSLRVIFNDFRIFAKLPYYTVKFDEKHDSEVYILELRSNLGQKWDPELQKMDLAQFWQQIWIQRHW